MYNIEIMLLETNVLPSPVKHGTFYKGVLY